MKTNNAKLTLSRIGVEEAENVWKMQVEAFWELYQKYQDKETSPATESLDVTVVKLKESFTYFYYILLDDDVVGAMRVVDYKDGKRPKYLTTLFVMPPYRNQGIAQKAILAAEEIHGGSGWELEAVLQERATCHLYEKMGYRQTGMTEHINDKLTLALYRKA